MRPWPGQHPGQYDLSRVFNVGWEPYIYMLLGSPILRRQLEPVLFRTVI